PRRRLRRRACLRPPAAYAWRPLPIRRYGVAWGWRTGVERARFRSTPRLAYVCPLSRTVAGQLDQHLRQLPALPGDRRARRWPGVLDDQPRAGDRQRVALA